MYVWWSVPVSQTGTELLGLRSMLGEVEEVMAFRLLDEEDVLLCARVLEVQYASLYECVPLETTADEDGVEIPALQTDGMGRVDKIMLLVDDDGTQVMSAMEYTGKLVRETLQPVIEVSEIYVFFVGAEVSE